MSGKLIVSKADWTVPTEEGGQQRNECEEEDILLTSSSSRWRRVREAGQSAGSLSLTRWCSDLVTWDEDDFYDKDEEDFYNEQLAQ